MRRAPVATALLLLAASAVGAEDVERSLAVGGITRTYIVHAPPGLSEKKTPVPLVLAFHGGGGRARGMEKLSGLDDVADRYGFLLVYPDAINRQWNDGRREGDVDDVGFIAALVKELSAGNPVDPNRIYATGISNGGFFSQTLACHLADTFAAVASVAATMGEPLLPTCKPTRPVSVMFIFGDMDPLVPIGGGAVARTRGVAVSLNSAVRFWVAHDHITARKTREEVPDRDPDDGTRTHRDVYAGGTDGTAVEAWTVESGGHTWPGGPQYLPKIIIGATSRDFDASEEIWKFFERHGRAKP